LRIRARPWPEGKEKGRLQKKKEFAAAKGKGELLKSGKKSGRLQVGRLRSKNSSTIGKVKK